MDRIHYAGDSILTGTEIARALLDYARALAQVGSSDTVDIPTIGPGGALGRSHVLVGPASQLISDAEESEFDDLSDPVLVAELREKAVQLRRYGTAVASTQTHPAEPAEGWTDFDEI